MSCFYSSQSEEYLNHKCILLIICLHCFLISNLDSFKPQNSEQHDNAHFELSPSNESKYFIIARLIKPDTLGPSATRY